MLERSFKHSRPEAQAFSSNPICELLGISFPLLQAGMGGVAVPELAAEVSSAGCAGIVALYKLRPNEIYSILRKTRELTRKPFGVNLIPEVVDGRLFDQVETVTKFGDRDVFFTFFGLPPEEVSSHIKRRGFRLIIQVGALEDAIKAVALGADSIIVQGHEAGGHHLCETDLDSLLVQIRSHIRELPLIAAGGIATGMDFARVNALGADGCMCGTIFVAAEESNAHRDYKHRVIQASREDTVVTDLFKIGWPGRPHRVLRNQTLETGRSLSPALIAKTRVGDNSYPIFRFSAAVPTRQTQGLIDDLVEHMAMYCGTSCEQVKTVCPAVEIVDRFQRESALALGKVDSTPAEL